MIFGLIGFLARRHGFAVALIAVGLILGEMVETIHPLKMFDGAWWQIFTPPLAALFLVFAAQPIWITGLRLADQVPPPKPPSAPTTAIGGGRGEVGLGSYFWAFLSSGHVG